jgi:hypothetical protein
VSKKRIWQLVQGESCVVAQLRIVGKQEGSPNILLKLWLKGGQAAVQ